MLAKSIPQHGGYLYKVAVLLIILFRPLMASDVLIRAYPDTAIAGQPYYIAISWIIPKGWHMEAPSEHMPNITWHLPSGLTLQQIDWPEAKPFSSPAVGGQSLGFDKRVTALAHFKVTKPFDTLLIKANIKWALCKDQCVLHEASVSLSDTLNELQWIDMEELINQNPKQSLPIIPFVFAFLGGLILNVMPCVLPVLSLKVIDFIHVTSYAPWLRGLMFTAGVSTGFLTLGTIMTGLKQGGTEFLGWGFHMQSPYFVSAMMLLFFIMGLNMWGFFEVGTTLTRFQLPKKWQHPLLKAWGVGLITCAVSTPCTAPFLGSALAYGLTASFMHLIGILLSISLGLSAPVLILTIFPSWMHWIPKPGLWMMHLKKIFSIGFFITACWLAWVLGSLTWSKHTSINLQQIEKMLASDQPIILHFTADWCLTCQSNKNVLDDKNIQNLIKSKGVQIITIDLTQHNVVGTRLLKQFQRSAIPLVVYSKGHNQYLMLPPIITKQNLLTLFQ